MPDYYVARRDLKTLYLRNILSGKKESAHNPLLFTRQDISQLAQRTSPSVVLVLY